ncbi:MAG: sulfatase-like hydrolase/transferase, partial [Bacteroidetes bacterium]|nr:sulfatase-like hydrolase/transferase [Bacteroidota bacterium]
MKSILNILFFVLLTLIVHNSSAEEINNQPPNVLMICVDDLNDWLGCMNGHPNAITPNMDKLASKGVLFTNAHCQAPICG